MKLLVPVDGSSRAINTVKKSIKIAKEYDYSIKLIMVINPHDITNQKRYSKRWHQVDGSIISGKNEITESLEMRAMYMLNEIVESLRIYDIDIEKEVLIGKFVTKILEAAKKENFDLIVMDNRGMSKFKWLFSCLAINKVLSKSPCPVLVVSQ